MDPFDLFGSDDDDKDDDAVDPNPADGIRIVGTNEAEKIAGTDGDDILLCLAGDDLPYFSRDGSATGGEGPDSFNMVISPDQGPGHVTDFVPAEDN